jgi:hypothetical protein
MPHNKSKNIVITIKGGAVQEVFSYDQDVSVTIIDMDVKKDCEGFSNAEIEKIIVKETTGLSKIITDIT